MKVSIVKYIVDKLKRSLAIVQDGDTATRNISKDKFVNWNGNIYTANQAIASGSTLSAASGGNLTACDDGALNKIGNDITAINSNIAKYEPALGDTLTDCNTAKNNGNHPTFSGITSNIPANNARVLEVFRRSNSVIFQRSLCIDGTTYTRYTTDGGTTWSAWEGLALNSKIENIKQEQAWIGSAKKWTKTLESGCGYLLFINRRNTTTTAVQGIYYIQAYNGDSCALPIVASSDATVSVSGLSLSVTLSNSLSSVALLKVLNNPT